MDKIQSAVSALLKAKTRALIEEAKKHVAATLMDEVHLDKQGKPVQSTPQQIAASNAKTNAFIKKRSGESVELMKRIAAQHKAAEVKLPGKYNRQGEKIGESETQNQAKCVGCKTPFKYTPKSSVDMRNLCDSCMSKLKSKKVTEAKEPRNNPVMHSKLTDHGFAYTGSHGGFQHYENEAGDFIKHKYPTTNGNHSFSHHNVAGEKVWGSTDVSNSEIHSHMKKHFPISMKESAELTEAVKMGAKVQVCHGSGCDSGREGTVVDHTKHRKHIEMGMDGRYKPFDPAKEALVKADPAHVRPMWDHKAKKLVAPPEDHPGAHYFTMFKNRLINK